MYPFNHGGPSPGAPPPSADGHPSSFRLYTGDPYPGAPPLSAYGHPSSFRLYTATPTLTPYGQFSTSMRFTGVAGQWSTGLCHCCDDPAICFITCLCPCITFGRIAEIVSKGSKPCYENGKLYGLLLMTGFACLYSCFYRSKLRMQYDLEEDPCTDCLVHFCCETCALSQEYRELRNRGFDMGIGWEANMDRQKRAIALPPIVTPGMTR